MHQVLGYLIDTAITLVLAASVILALRALWRAGRRNQ